jgi:hypothetical protein
MAGNPKDSCSRDSKPAKQLPAEWWSGRPSCRMTEDWSDRPANSHSLLAVTQVIRNRPWEFQKLGFADSHCPFLLPFYPSPMPTEVWRRTAEGVSPPTTFLFEAARCASASRRPRLSAVVLGVPSRSSYNDHRTSPVSGRSSSFPSSPLYQGRRAPLRRQRVALRSLEYPASGRGWADLRVCY